MYKNMGRSERLWLKSMLKDILFMIKLNKEYKIHLLNIVIIAVKAMKKSVVAYEDVIISEEEYLVLEDIIDSSIRCEKISEFYSELQSLYNMNKFYTSNSELKNMLVPGDIFDEDQMFIYYANEIDALWNKYFTIHEYSSNQLVLNPEEDEELNYEFNQEEFNKVKDVLGEYYFGGWLEHCNSSYYSSENETYFYEIKINQNNDAIGETPDKYFEAIKNFANSWIDESQGDYMAESYYNDERNSIVIISNYCICMLEASYKIEFLQLIALITGSGGYNHV